MNDIMGEASGSISSSGAVANSVNSNSPIATNSNGSNGNNNNGKASVVAATVAANGGERISAAVTKVLQGYDWTLVPVATK